MKEAVLPGNGQNSSLGEFNFNPDVKIFPKIKFLEKVKAQSKKGQNTKDFRAYIEKVESQQI